jgi:hypothetical protein
MAAGKVSSSEEEEDGEEDAYEVEVRACKTYTLRTRCIDCHV